jgi:hypothetical protein
VAGACTVDDAWTASARTRPGAFCPEGETTGTTDKVADDMRRVVVEVRWQRGRAQPQRAAGRGRAQPGNAAGPEVTGLTPSRPSPLTTDGAPWEVTWTALVPAQTTRVQFKLDGVLVDDDTTPANGWSWTWNTESAGDCTYTVTAQAFERPGARAAAPFGTQYEDQPPHARGAQAVVLTNEAGSAGDAACARRRPWTSTGARDATATSTATASTAARTRTPCAPSTTTRRRPPACSPRPGRSTSTRARTPPPRPPSIAYAITALDRAPNGTLRESPRASLTITNGNRQGADRDRPFNVSATRNADGTVTVRWQHGAPGNSMTSAQTEYYRVYRGGTTFPFRIGRTGDGNELEFIDAAAVPGRGDHRDLRRDRRRPVQPERELELRRDRPSPAVTVTP